MLKFTQLHPNQQLRYVIQAGMFKYFNQPESAIQYFRRTNPTITSKWLQSSAM